MRTIKSLIFGGTITYDEKQYVDLEGNIVERNPIEYPYSYSPYVIYKSSDYKKEDTPYYNDRIMHCYFKGEDIMKALNQMGLKLYGARGERLSWKEPKIVERFMSILLKEEVKCTAITEGCRPYDGYLYWIIYIQHKQ